jgi:two-component system phosphate regulon sensor histidine kinase PhoR
VKVRHKLLLFGAALAVVTGALVFFAGGVLLRRSVGDRVSERLENEVRLVAQVLAEDPSLLPYPQTALAEPSRATDGSGAVPAGDASSYGRIDEFADETGSLLGLRVTIIGADGTVLGDSSLDGEALLREENHAHRPEIVQARREGPGRSVRYSDTVKDNLHYVARRIERNGAIIGYARLAIPVWQVEQVTGAYSLTLAAFSFAVLIGVTGLGYLAARRFSRPLEAMSETANAIASGQRSLVVGYESDDEIGRLGAAFNRMTRALSEQIAALSSENRLRAAILGGMREGILVVDREKRVLLCNDALRWMLSLRGADPVGRPLIEIARDEAITRAFDHALQGGEELRSPIRSGLSLERRLDLGTAPLTDAAGVQIGAIGLFTDVTRLTALESVRRDFVADVSHELRTPLTSIKAFVETLLAGGLEDTANNRRFLEIVEKHADRMEAILDDLTDLSLIETGATELEFADVDLAAVCGELIESLRPKAAAAGVSLVMSLPVGTLVRADRRRLEQILTNLLDNAIKFNHRGGSVTLRAFDGHEEDPGDFVRIEIADTGIGIPAEHLDRIFNRFYRVDRGRSREMGGTGLGLSIVKHLMHGHGGRVRVESQAGRGSRFILEFPAVLSDRPS